MAIRAPDGANNFIDMKSNITNDTHIDMINHKEATYI